MLGGSLHPFYRNILTRATGSGYELPSVACQRLQNTLVKNLVDGGVWPVLDFFCVGAHHGLVNGALEFIGINWAQPSLTLQAISMGNALISPKKGVYTNGSTTINYNYRYHQNQSAFSINDCMCFAMLGLSSGTVTAAEVWFQMNDGNAYWTMRQRTNPRVDNLMHLTAASPQVIQNSLATAQRLYTHDVGSSALSFLYYDGTLQSTNVIGGGNSIIAGTAAALFSNVIPSTRPVALFGGGASMYRISSNHTRQAALNTAIQNYMNALNLLP